MHQQPGRSSATLEASNLPFSPIVSSPNVRALGLGVLSYFVVGPIVGWLLPHVPHGIGVALLAIFLFLPGVLLGYLAKRSPLMHGLLLGILIVIVMALLFVLGGALGVKGMPLALHDLGSMAAGGVVALMIASSLGAVAGNFIGDKLHGL
jgi:hypothetical protein